MGKFDNYINVTAPIHSATVKGKLGNANEIFLEGDTKNIEGSREIFKFEVTKTGRTGKSTSTTRYLCYSGGNPANTITEEVINSLNKHSATGVNFNPTVVTKSNDYIWLIVPNYLTIHGVKSAGFDVLLSSPQTITTSFGTFKAYRTINTLTAQSWNLVIS